MISDYAELIAEVVERTGDANVPLRAKMFTGLAEIDLSKRLKTSAQETLVTLTTDANGSVALPSDFEAMRTIVRGGCELPQAHLIDLKDKSLNGYAVQAGALVTSYPSADLDLTYYASIPSLTTNSTNWLLTASPEIYLYAVMRQVFMAAMDAEKALAAGQFLNVLVDEFQDRDGAIRFQNTPYVVRGDTP